ncbi:MAG TPA: SseB family protein [Acidiferrobacterales bacterium]|jgi:hypothetical protein
MSDEFQPRNELEKDLVAAQDGRIGSEAFMKRLLGAQLFMPVRDSSPIKNFQTSDKAVPLTVQAEGGTEVLILFTSPERAKGFVQDFPGYHGGILADFQWILERVGSGLGIALNPGWEVGFDMEPDAVQSLRADMRKDA